MIREIPRRPLSGIPLLILIPLMMVGTGFLTILLFSSQYFLGGFAGILLFLVLCVMLAGFFMVAPNEGVVLQLFGDYKGTAREPGLRWANPFFATHKVSNRVRNFETGKLKVND